MFWVDRHRWFSLPRLGGDSLCLAFPPSLLSSPTWRLLLPFPRFPRPLFRRAFHASPAPSFVGMGGTGVCSSSPFAPPVGGGDGVLEGV